MAVWWVKKQPNRSLWQLFDPFWRQVDLGSTCSNWMFCCDSWLYIPCTAVTHCLAHTWDAVFKLQPFTDTGQVIRNLSESIKWWFSYTIEKPVCVCGVCTQSCRFEGGGVTDIPQFKQAPICSIHVFRVFTFWNGFLHPSRCVFKTLSKPAHPRSLVNSWLKRLAERRLQSPFRRAAWGWALKHIALVMLCRGYGSKYICNKWDLIARNTRYVFGWRQTLPLCWSQRLKEVLGQQVFSAPVKTGFELQLCLAPVSIVSTIRYLKQAAEKRLLKWAIEQTRMKKD